MELLKSYFSFLKQESIKIIVYYFGVLTTLEKQFCKQYYYVDWKHL